MGATYLVTTMAGIVDLQIMASSNPSKVQPISATNPLNLGMGDHMDMIQREKIEANK